ncbi:MAG: hypothetical protein IPM54_29010 [Polyangiaceae bacterium]|nr:hypothetical protein [Polyangiaceae bacterium]
MVASFDTDDEQAEQPSAANPQKAAKHRRTSALTSIEMASKAARLPVYRTPSQKKTSS